MRNRRRKCKLSGLILAVMAAGSLGLPAGAAQSTAQAATAPAAHKTTGTPRSTPAATSSKKKSASVKSSNKKKSKKVKGQAAPTPERISEIQAALAKKGLTEVSPTGKWDDSTAEAVRKFQSSNGLNPTGKLDALTLQKLGLGSETAGLAVPTPPPNSVNRLRNTASSPMEPPDSEPPPRN
jgi:peptidoglycan hydrolase-like protein with peptidoglycan-binding domain